MIKGLPSIVLMSASYGKLNVLKYTEDVCSCSPYFVAVFLILLVYFLDDFRIAIVSSSSKTNVVTRKSSRMLRADASPLS